MPVFLRLRLQGNMGNAFMLKSMLDFFDKQLCIVNAAASIYDDVGSQGVLIAGDGPEMHVMDSQNAFCVQNGAYDIVQIQMARRSLHQYMKRRFGYKKAAPQH